MWTLPVVYPVMFVPEQFPSWLVLNPPFAFIDALRGALLTASRPMRAIGW